MSIATNEDIATVIGGIFERTDRELFAYTSEELEQHYWHFSFDTKASDSVNLYRFHDMLKLYGHFCRRWEEHHNGSCCVVERVRDKYLMPKIRRFLAGLSDNSTQQR